MRQTSLELNGNKQNTQILHSELL